MRCTITKNGRYRYLWPWERRDESQVAVVFAQMSVFLSANQNKFLMLKAMLQRCEIDRNTYIDKIHTSSLLIMFLAVQNSSIGDLVTH